MQQQHVVSSMFGTCTLLMLLFHAIGCEAAISARNMEVQETAPDLLPVTLQRWATPNVTEVAL